MSHEDPYQPSDALRRAQEENNRRIAHGERIVAAEQARANEALANARTGLALSPTAVELGLERQRRLEAIAVSTRLATWIGVALAAITVVIAIVAATA